MRLQRIRRMPGAGTKLLEATEQRGPVRAYRLSPTYPYVIVAFEYAEQLVEDRHVRLLQTLGVEELDERWLRLGRQQTEEMPKHIRA